MEKSLKGASHTLYTNCRHKDSMIFIDQTFANIKTNFKNRKLPNRREMLDILKCLSILSNSQQKTIQSKFTEFRSIIKEIIPEIIDSDILGDIEKSRLFPEFFQNKKH